MVKCYENENLDLIFQALSHGIRRQMLLHLRSGAFSAQDLADPFPISLPAISKHLKILEKANLVQRIIRGRQHFFRVKPVELQKALTWVNHFEIFWDEKLNNLEQFLKEEGK